MITKIENKMNKIRFTDRLEELVCKKACDLQSALLLLSQNSNKKNKLLAKTASNLYSSLKRGNSFSLALKTCPYIEFDEVYISFITFAERCGQLGKTLTFLKARGLREKENADKLIEASVYPFFVVLISISATVGLYLYSKSLWGQEDMGFSFSQETYSSFYASFGFLIAFCFAAFLLLRKTLGTNKLYEAFLASGFLVKGGESLTNAVKGAVNILGYTSKEGQLFAQAGKKLSYGLNLKAAFEIDLWKFSMRQELEEAFFYAEKTGGENDAFEKIALWLNNKDEKKRAICFKLLEPFFVCGTGIFLLIFLMNLVLPIFNQNTIIF